MILRGFLIVCLMACATVIQAQQEQDTTSKTLINKIQETKASKAIVHSITRRPVDTVFNIKSEDLFMPYSDRIVRNIIINHIGFDKTMYDTARSIKNTITRIGNSLHSNTKPWVIRDNLFIEQGKPLNPYKLADNERHLRDLDFVLDARITLKRVGKDSIDIIIVTRDVFSIGASFSPRSATKYKFKIRDTNLAGWGQQLQFNGLYESDRYPAFGPEVIYSKSSVLGSLINLSTGITTLNNGSSYGDENEYAAYVRLDRPLVSPYSRLAGAFELSRNWSENVYLTSDSLFRNYDYDITDFWIGYNIGINNSFKNRNRHFISIRTFQQRFAGPPSLPIDSLNPVYNDKKFVLGQITFFNQNYYKTRYIYGFGRTEDVPYGQTISLLAGWVNQLYTNRLYVGTDFERSFANKKGDFYLYALRTEAFRYKHEFQDISALLSGSVNTRLYVHRRVKLRQSFRASYTQIFKPTINLPLLLDNDFGVIGLASDSVRGVKRLGLHLETVFYTNWKLLGFRFAPLIFGDVAFIAKNKESIFYDKPYCGVGVGVRTRNENLVFGTIEARCTFYPRIEEGEYFRLSLRSNLRVKFSGSLVKPPALIRYN